MSSIQQNIIRYLDSEQDRRGYVKHKGWAHAVAHAADVIDDLVQCHEVRPHEIWQLLDVVQRTVATNTTVYIFGEDERCATAVNAALRRNPHTDARILEWLQRFVTLAQQPDDLPALPSLVPRFGRSGCRRHVNLAVSSPLQNSYKRFMLENDECNTYNKSELCPAPRATV